MRTICPGDAWIEVVAVYEADGVTPHTGLLDAAFTKTVWRDGAVVALAVTVVEIGTSGTYRASCTPTSAGAYALRITNSYNDDALGAEAQVAVPDALGITGSDDGTTITLAVWVARAGVRLTDVTSVAAIIRTTAGTSVADLGTDSTPTAQGVFTFTVAASTLTRGVAYTLDATVTRAGVAWAANVGFARV
jgi:hypothetical protein